jgi:tetratricopeptide (TPR) repeat protein
MAQFGVKSARLSVTAALEQHHTDAALEVLIQAQSFDLPITQAKQWLELWEKLPLEVRLRDPASATGYVLALARADLDLALLQFSQMALERFFDSDLAMMHSERAWALSCQGDWQAAHGELMLALATLQGIQRGRALRRLIWVEQRLGLEWERHIPEAATLLTNLPLGVLYLDVGNCYLFENRYAEAREIWFDALGLLLPDPMLLARCHTQIGYAFLAQCLPEAEYHFSKASEIAGNARRNSPRFALVRGAQCSAWVGLGTWHTTQGQYRRAENAFVRGQRLAQNGHERVQCLLGLARIHRFTQNHSVALERLSQLMREPAHLQPPMYLERAANFALIGKLEDAKRALQRIKGALSSSWQQLEKIVRAEIYRQEGQQIPALECLLDMDLQNRVAREEALVFGKLFAWYKELKFVIPEPLRQQTRTSIRVMACGALKVYVNQQPLALDPSAKTGLALIAMLEQPDHSIGAVRLAEMLWDANENVGRSTSERLALVSDVIRNLRELLHDPQIIRTAKRTYHLDSSIDWFYDVSEVRAGKLKCKQFLEGVYFDWVLEIGRELQQVQ